MIGRPHPAVLLLAVLTCLSACAAHNPPTQGNNPPVQDNDPPVPVSARVVDAASGTPIGMQFSQLENKRFDRIREACSLSKRQRPV